MFLPHLGKFLFVPYQTCDENSLTRATTFAVAALSNYCDALPPSLRAKASNSRRRAQDLARLLMLNSSTNFVVFAYRAIR